MNSRSIFLQLMLIGGCLLLVDHDSLAQTPQVTRTELQRAAISNLTGHEGVMYKAVIVPGGAAAKHTHPGDEFLYILKGTLIVEAEGKAPVTLNVGDSFYQPSGTPHLAKNGSTTDPVEVLVFLVVESGKPLASAVE